MWSHYFSIAFRQLVKNKLFSLISVAGLAIGLASVFLIYQYLKQESSYDRFHKGYENIYRITWNDNNPQTRTPHPMALAMARDFSEVENGTTLTPLYGPGMTRRTFSMRNPEKNIRFDETGVMGVDTTFLDIFTFPLIKGNPKTALKNPGAILISESMAKKYFGDEEPLGKHLAVNNESQFVEIAGVFKDVPPNSHFHFDVLVSYVRMKAGNPTDKWYTWDDFGHYNYVRLKPGTNVKDLEARLMDWVPKYLVGVKDELVKVKKLGYHFELQPIADIHLKSNLHWELEANGNISYVYMMTAAGLLILIIAGINFINLTTAQSTDRAKEIGIRKSLGAFRRQLSGQFIGESMLVALIGSALAVLLIELSLPFYNAFTLIPIHINFLDVIIFLSAAALIAGFVAGIYPALYLSMIKPGVILKGRFIQSPGGSVFRSSFMVFQFFASMVLICCSLIIFSQLNYVRNKSLGFNKEELIVLPIKNREAIVSHFESLQSELLRIPGIQSVSAASNIPGRNFNQNPIFAANQPDMRVSASEAFVDYDIFKTLDIQLKEGRLFSKENPADKDAFILNETAANNLYPDGAVGKQIVWEDEDGNQKRTVIGVVRDFHFQSLHEPVRPLILIPSPYFNYVLVKVNTADFASSISRIESTWKKFDDQFGFEFSFLSDQLNTQYENERNMATVMIFFSVLAVMITCVGLLGIAALTFRQRTKEVSIRKVLGATLASVTWLLLQNFTKLVLMAVVLAVPFVWWLMSNWLNNFAFRTTINPLVFAVSSLLLVAVTWGTLSYLTIRIAKVNPAEILKAE